MMFRRVFLGALLASAIACTGSVPIRQAGEAGPAADDASRRVIFLTSVSYAADLGGLPGADAKCRDLAAAVGLPGTFKAWLSDEHPPGTYLVHATLAAGSDASCMPPPDQRTSVPSDPSASANTSGLTCTTSGDTSTCTSDAGVSSTCTGHVDNAACTEQVDCTAARPAASPSRVA
jgi:hypothetical protein